MDSSHNFSAGRSSLTILLLLCAWSGAVSTLPGCSRKDDKSTEIEAANAKRLAEADTKKADRVAKFSPQSFNARIYDLESTVQKGDWELAGKTLEPLRREFLEIILSNRSSDPDVRAIDQRLSLLAIKIDGALERRRVEKERSTAAENYAALEYGGPPPVALTRRVDNYMALLELKCTQQRIGASGEPGLSDISVKAVQRIRRDGVQIGYLEFLQQYARAVGELQNKQDCVPIAATLMVLHIQGNKR